MLVVVNRGDLKRYRNVIVLNRPKWCASASCRDGILRYDSVISWNGEKYCGETLTLPTGFRTSTIIATSVGGIRRCVGESYGKLVVEFSSPSVDDDQYVILAAVSSTALRKGALKPSSSLLEHLRQYKTSIVQEGNHYGARGLYFGFGLHASYNKNRIDQYACNTVPMRVKNVCENIFSEMLSSVCHGMEALERDAGFNVVEVSSRLTHEICVAAHAINQIRRKMGLDDVVLSPLEGGGKSLHFVSANLCVNASSENFHTENDQGYTLVHSFHQDTCPAEFVFRISESTEITIPLTPGVSVLFDAQFLTHRQRIDPGVSNGVPFWNAACYTNRRFECFAFNKICSTIDGLCESVLSIIS